MAAVMMNREDCGARFAALWSGRPMGDVRKDRVSSGVAGIDIFFSQKFVSQLATGLCNTRCRLSLANRALDQEKSIESCGVRRRMSFFSGKCADQNKTFTELSPKSDFVQA
jgi:hypothetical protein